MIEPNKPELKLAMAKLLPEKLHLQPTRHRHVQSKRD